MELDPKDQRRDPDLRDVSVEDIAFYYDEMVRSDLVELEVETPKGKLILKRRQLERAMEVTNTQHGIVRHKIKQMREMEAQLEERQKLFDRWMREIEELERDAGVSAAKR